MPSRLMSDDFINKIKNIPPDIILALRFMAEDSLYADNQDFSDRFDNDTQTHVRNIMGRIHSYQDRSYKGEGGVPSDSSEIATFVIHLVNNPNDSDNKEFLYNNPAFFGAFPILKQVYGSEETRSSRFFEDRTTAIEDYTNMFGKENTPRYLLAKEETAANSFGSNIEGFRREAKSLLNRGPDGGKANPITDIDTEKLKELPVSSEEHPPLGSVVYPEQKAQTYESEAPDFNKGVQNYTDDNAKLQEQLRSGYTTTTKNVTAKAPQPPRRAYPIIPPTSLNKVERSLEKQKQKPEDNINEQYNPSGFTRHGQDFSDVQGPEITPSQNQAAVPSMEKSYDPDGVTSERGRDSVTIQKDIAITEALENGDYEKVKEIEEAYKKYERLPTDNTDDYSYMGSNRQRGGLVGYQEGGGVPLEADPAYNEPDMGFVGTPEEGAMDQLQAAQNGEMGGDNVETEVPEGSFVLNSYAVELAGIKDIESLIDDAKKFVMGRMGEEGFATQTETGEDVEVRVSEGEYIIPPALVRIIGRDRLEKINKRGIAEFERQQAEETEMGGQEMPQGPQQPQGFMPPQEGGVPMPAEVPPEQMQGFAIGGGVQQQQPRMITIGEDTLKAALASKPHTPPKPKQQQMAQAPKQRVAQPPRQRAVQQRQQPVSPLTPVNPMAPGAQNLQNTNMRMANMGGFIPYSRNG